ncbi:MAG TPA: sugar phosphate isomerase/epimerase [bacterium]|nr:sugar phosphate isomerase/epimerase [bacterium]HOL34734.1 sugar phosphate isomerase/epimerase [bacterium]HPP08321.1 sugar phosphate isomerase/epimerase [bacterium]
MYKQYKLGACLPTFGSCADRFCLSGYGRGGRTMEEMLELAKQVEGLDGLELVSNWHVNDKNINYVAKLFKDAGFKICMIVPDLWTQAKWGKGSIAAPDAKTRKQAIVEIKKSIDWAAELGCEFVDVWPGQDGYDYPFQAHYDDAWKWLRDGIEECALYNKKVKVLVEYKMKEPRTHCFVSNAAKVILLINGITNTGCLLDVGHSLAAGENMAEAASLLAQYKVLSYIHLNDNYRSWDDDLLVSSVHVVEYLELVYWLKEVKYDGWLTLDIFPYREDKVPAARNSFEWLKFLFEKIEQMGSEEIRAVIRQSDGNLVSSLVRKMLGG